MTNNKTIYFLLSKNLISKRTYNICKYNGLLSEKDIYNFYCNNSFNKLRNCGKKSMVELENISYSYSETIADNNLNLNEPNPELFSIIKLIINVLFNISENKIGKKILLIKSFFLIQQKKPLEIIEIFFSNKDLLRKDSYNDIKKKFLINNINIEKIGNKKLIEILRFVDFILNISIKIEKNIEKKLLVEGFEKNFFDFIFRCESKTISLEKSIMEINKKFNDLILTISEKEVNALKISCNILLSKRDFLIFNDFLNENENSFISKKHGLTNERIRQKIEFITNNDEIINFYSFLKNNGFKKFKLNNKENDKEIIFDETSEGKRGPQSSNPKKLRDYCIKINGENELNYLEIDVFKILNFKDNYHQKNTFPNFLLKKDLFDKFEKCFYDFYINLIKKNNPIRTEDFNEEFVLLLKKHKDYLFPQKNVFVEHPYTYYTSKISTPFLCELSISQSNSKTKTLRIKEIFNWIKKKFPNKKLKTIDGLRGALINSKNIIAFGKTGNYGLKNDFGVNKSSELSTKNLLKVILNKNKNPLTLEFLEDEVQKMNPFLKDRGVAMIVEINPKLFIKYKSSGSRGNPMFIGLKGKKYSQLPVDYDSNKLYDYLRSKNLSQEWVSLVFLINTFKMPKYQIMDFLLKNDYFIVNKMISLSTGDKKKDLLIRKLVLDKNLIKKINKFLSLNIKQKTLFKNKLKKIINLNYEVSFDNNDISKIINFII